MQGCFYRNKTEFKWQINIEWQVSEIRPLVCYINKVLSFSIEIFIYLMKIHKISDIGVDLNNFILIFTIYFDVFLSFCIKLILKLKFTYKYHSWDLLLFYWYLTRIFCITSYVTLHCCHLVLKLLNNFVSGLFCLILCLLIQDALVSLVF